MGSGDVVLACILLYRVIIFYLITLSKISFTLYPAHGRVGRGNLVLRHSVPNFPMNSGGIKC